MSCTIERVADAASVHAFEALLDDYETSLPVRLRHGALDDAALKKLVIAPNNAFLALQGSVAIGCIAVFHLDADTAVIQRLYVSPEARGSGAGKQLMRAAIAYASSRGYARVVLDTDPRALPEAYALYRALGFTECAPFMETGYSDAQYMELPLTSQ